MNNHCQSDACNDRLAFTGDELVMTVLPLLSPQQRYHAGMCNRCRSTPNLTVIRLAACSMGRLP